MKQVAKVVLVDNQNKYLMMYRSDHPTLGNDPDLPGGLVEKGESPAEAMQREVAEEAGVTIDLEKADLIYKGAEFSEHETTYWLYMAKLEKRPVITMSWEHSSYEWLSRDDFLQKSKGAKDTYMHMVYAELKNI
jgi:mutator protein MutT